MRDEPKHPQNQWMGSDEIQYYPAGPEFKLSREAAALKAQRAAERSQGLARDGTEDLTSQETD